MHSVVSWLVALFLGMAAFQSLFAVWFALRMKAVRPYAPSASKGSAEGSSPQHVSILMALRGADPCLKETLQGLVDMDYPSFDLRIIVDSRHDPAWKIVEEFVQESGAKNVLASSIGERRTTCGLQCTAFSQAVRELPSETDIVMTVDGDIRAHKTLLSSLVAPFENPKIGLTFGNRWFTPADLRWGSWVRYLWNSAAVVPMYLFGIPWGGCFAIRKSSLLESGLADAWTKVMVHDAPAKSLLAKIGQEVAFVPSLMIGNSDSCSLQFSHDFLKRQMLWTRLYHPNFAPVLIHALVTSAMTAILIALGLIGLVFGDLSIWIIAWGGLLSYLIWLTMLVALIEHSVRHVFAIRSSELYRYTMLSWVRMPVAILVTQAVYCSAILLATLRNDVLWRGIRYRIKSAYDVERLNDVVFEQKMDGDSL